MKETNPTAPSAIESATGSSDRTMPRRKSRKSPKTRQLERLNLELERRVAERTAELESYAYRLTESERRRSLALAASDMGSWDWDVSTGECNWDEGQYRIFGVEPETFKVTPERLKALLEPAEWLRLNDALEEVSPASPTCETEFRVRRPNGDVRWCLGRAAATFSPDDRIARISGVTVDITDQKQAQERQLLLTREVEHRARNLLAVVQSMLRLTKANNIQDYMAAIEGRIGALSRAHMLLSECRWEGAFLRRLVDEELNHYRDGHTNAISAEGPELLLESSRAQTIALALHELATNAAKHGALATPSGRLQLNWTREEDTLHLDWVESGGAKVRTPKSLGYGVEVISASIEHLGGHVDFDWRPEGMRCKLSVPLTEPVRPATT
jgi:PAS domain S-box-containing protein